MTQATTTTRRCLDCGRGGGRLYEERRFGAAGEPAEVVEVILCPGCARARRRVLIAEPVEPEGEPEGVTREEMMAELEHFFGASGALGICARCHAQGTGCCPAPCRSLTPEGCRRKTLWCSAFVCGALLNALAEVDAETGRALRWIKGEVGPAEFRLFEMVSRAPADRREGVRPLRLARRYPRPAALADPERLRPALEALADEVLEVRRLWRVIEETEAVQADTDDAGDGPSGRK